MPEVTDVTALVRGLFEAQGLKPSEEEIALFVGLYPMLRAAIDMVYAVPKGEER